MKIRIKKSKIISEVKDLDFEQPEGEKMVRGTFKYNLSKGRTHSVLGLQYNPDTKNTSSFTLYRLVKINNELKFYVVGDIFFRKPKSKFPCIPNTFEVAAIYVEPGMKNVTKGARDQKYGLLLYDLLFYYASTMGHGLTSDHEDGTTKAAQKFWKYIENNPSMYRKRKTDGSGEAGGHDVFDYKHFDGRNRETLDTGTFTGSSATPNDPNDDCHLGNDIIDDPDRLATTSSWQKIGIENFRDIYNQLVKNDKQLKDIWKKSGKKVLQLTKSINKSATGRFKELYDKQKTKEKTK